MEILGIGPMELILILIVALMVFGPDRLPQIGAKLGRAMREMRKATRAISDEINSTRAAIEAPARELAEPFKDVTDAAKSAGAIAAVARNPGQALRDSVMREFEKPLEPASAGENTESQNTIAPPPASESAATEAGTMAGVQAEPAPALPEPTEPVALLAAPTETIAALPGPEEAVPAPPAPEQLSSLAATGSSSENDNNDGRGQGPGPLSPTPPEQ